MQNFIKHRLKVYLQLIRFNKPIGTLLLMWPMLTALVAAAEGMPSTKNVLIFLLGCLSMRSAGCAINDFADRKIDGHVERTKMRPLAQGTIKPVEALLIALMGFLFSFLLVLQTNSLTIMLSLVAVLLASLYPFVKRFSQLPQVVLGMAFGWAVPMAYAAEINTLPPAVWWLFAATVIWAVAYDTEYAMVDRKDDIELSVKSSAILLGKYDKVVVFLCHSLTLLMLYQFGVIYQFGFAYQLSLGIALMLAIYQQCLIYYRQREKCFQAFLNNHYFGLVIFLGVLIETVT